VLLKEMQSLSLDVNVVSEEGAHAEMRDEDDDLLRAAEELGIDLSGVRAGADPGDGEEGVTEDIEQESAADAEGDAAEAAVDGGMDAGDEQLSVETDGELALEDLDDLGDQT
jgi:DNA-directed RNA polymerase subunit beta